MLNKNVKNWKIFLNDQCLMLRNYASVKDPLKMQIDNVFEYNKYERFIDMALGSLSILILTC